MKIFLDTNVVLDYLTGREPFADDAEAVIEICTAEENEAVITTLSACNIVYVLQKAIGKALAEQRLKELLTLVGLVGVDADSVTSSFDLPHSDFEDAVQSAEARAWGADVIVTRDPHGFANSPIKVLGPAEFLDRFAL